jgi:hypothetical protein
MANKLALGLTVVSVLLLGVIAYAVVNPCAWLSAEVKASMPELTGDPKYVRRIDELIYRNGSLWCMTRLVRSRLGW